MIKAAKQQNPNSKSNRTLEEKSTIRKLQTPKELQEFLLSDLSIQEQFKSYLVREFCVENILFVIALKDFRDIDANSSLGVEKMKELVNQFVKENSPYEVNVSSSIRNKALKAISTEIEASTDGTFKNTEMFSVMESEVYKMMLDPFNRFAMKAADSVIGGKKTSMADEEVSKKLSARLDKNSKILLKEKTSNDITSKKLASVVPLKK